MQNNICLYCVGGSHAGDIFTLEDEITIIGRDVHKCSIIYGDNEPGISGIHCQVKVLQNEIELTDLGSSYGTFLNNGIQLQKNVPQKIANGGGFYIGNKNNKFLVKIR